MDVMAFFHSDGFLKVAAAVCAAAVATKAIAAPHTIAYQIATGVEGVCLVLGVSSTTSREKK